MTTVFTRFKIRRDTAADWASVNPVLLDGEPALETDTDKVKYGDGVTAWNSLPYAAGVFTQAEIEEFARDAIGAALTNGANITITVNDGANTITIAVTGTLPVANGGTGVTSSTGSGSVVLSESPILGDAGTDSNTKVIVRGTSKGLRIGTEAGTSRIDGVDNTGSGSYQPLLITASALDLGIGGIGHVHVVSAGLNLASSKVFQINGTQVVTARQTGWGAATGTATRTAIATYTAPTISNPPTQAEVQAIADAVQAWTRRMKALTDDFATHGLIGT